MVPGQAVGAQDDVAALQVAVLSRQVEPSHPVVTLQLQPGPGSDQIAEDVGETLQDRVMSSGHCVDSVEHSNSIQIKTTTPIKTQ